MPVFTLKTHESK